MCEGSLEEVFGIDVDADVGLEGLVLRVGGGVAAP